MALDTLLAVLLSEAEAEAEAILAAARAEAESIRSHGEAEVVERQRRLELELESERRTAVELALAAARRDARREELLARERMIERVLAAARARFPAALRTVAFRSGLPAQVRQGLECLAGRPATLRCHPDLTLDIAPLVADQAGIQLTPDPATGSGFRLRSEDGALEINATLEDRLQRLDRRVRQEVLSRLEREP
jgi:vacuolar-type H+-ATPase subunit E/Vma4